MSEVLSQSQIDALLNSMSGSGDSTEDSKPPEPIETFDEKRVRNYNFRSPKKFTKDKIRLIDSIYDNYSKSIGSYISTLLRYGTEIKVSQVYEERYAEFVNALDDSDVVSVLNATSDDDATIAGSMVVQITKSVAYNIIDRSLGGTGDAYVTDKGFTEIEMTMFNSIISKIAPRMHDAWSNHVSLNVEFDRSETNPSLVQAIGFDDIVVIVILELNFKNAQGILNICIPTSILEGLFKFIDKNKANANKRKDVLQLNYEDEIFGSLKTSELDIKAVLGKTIIDLSDLYALQVGDVIQIDKNKDDDVELLIGEKEWFRGSLGTVKNNLAIKINEVNADTDIKDIII